MWDHRLIYAASSDSNGLQHELSSSNSELVEKPRSANGHLIDGNMPVKPGKGLRSFDSVLVDVKLNEGHDQGG